MKIIDIYTSQGFGAVCKKILIYPFRILWNKTPLRAWWLGDHYFIGRIVEVVYGNTINLDGLKIYIDNPAISTAIKCRFVMNRYEREERRAIKNFLDPKLPTVEFGGSIGVIACLTNKISQIPEKHVVIEANPELIPILRKNKELNNCKFEILHKAIGYQNNTIEFFLHHKFIGGSAQRKTEKSVRVETVTLGELIQSHNFQKINLVCDIEGAEVELIDKEGFVLSKYVSLFIVELHPAFTNETPNMTIDKMSALGFSLVHREKSNFIFKNNHDGR